MTLSFLIKAPAKALVLAFALMAFHLSAATISLIHNPFQYSYEYTDSESNLQYLTARYYDAKTRRFIGQDSVDLLNRYNYADGNPVMNEDPSGHMSALIGTMLGITAPTAAGILLTTEYSMLNRFDTLSLILTAVSAATGIASLSNDDQSLAVVSIVTMGLAVVVRTGYGALVRRGLAYDREGYLAGYNRDGFDRENYDRDGFHRDTHLHRNGTPYNGAGYDYERYDRDGYNSKGFNRNNIHRNGTPYDDEGYDYLGYDREGYDRRGFNRERIHRNGTLYDDLRYGRDYEGYDRGGLDRNYHDREGHLCGLTGWRSCLCTCIILCAWCSNGCR